MATFRSLDSIRERERRAEIRRKSESIALAVSAALFPVLAVALAVLRVSRSLDMDTSGIGAQKPAEQAFHIAETAETVFRAFLPIIFK